MINKDKRIKLVNEVLNGIKVISAFALQQKAVKSYVVSVTLLSFYFDS